MSDAQPDPTTEPQAAQAAGKPQAGPLSILICGNCGKNNKIRPSVKGAPHCGSCGKVLAWLVNATDDTFDIEAEAASAVVVDLWAPWCGPCRIVGPILEDLSREYAGRLKVVKVNVDENPVTAQRFQAFSIPTMVVLKNGRVVDRIVGAMPKGQLSIRLTPHLLRT
jgi:thioredoxin 2